MIRSVSLIASKPAQKRLLGAISLVVSWGVGCQGPVSEPRESDETTTASPAGPLLFVTNEDSGDITVVDTGSETHSVLTTIPVGKRPRGVRISPDGETIYAALSGSPKCPPWMSDEECESQITDKSLDGIAVIDRAALRVVETLPSGSDPEQFDVSLDGSRLFIANEDAAVASTLDLDAKTIISSVKVGEEPEGVRLQPGGARVWVTGETDHNVTVIDTETGEVVRQVRVGHRPRDIAFSPDGALAYVSAEIDGTVSVVDTASFEVIETIALEEDARTMGVAVSADGKTLYVTNGRSKTLSRIDLESKQVRSVEVGERPWGIALSADGRRVYTANGPSNDVSVVDAETLQVIARIPVGDNPWGLALAR